MNLEKTIDKELGVNFSRLETLRNLHHYDAVKTVDGQTLEGLVKPAYELIETMKMLCEMKQSSNVKPVNQ